MLDLNLALPIAEEARHDQLAFLEKLNEEHRRKYPSESELEARIRNYELAARMQLAAADVLDLSKESEATKQLYGLDSFNTTAYGTRLLMARRLVEAGVRFVHPQSQPWDSHRDVKNEIETISGKRSGFSRVD